MSAVKKQQPVSVEEYLAGELISHVKHEFDDGYVYAMAGARNAHNRIATNILVTVGFRLQGKRCVPFNSDTKVHIPAPPRERFYYPDALVVCKPNPPEDSFQDNPAVIFEVLSQQSRRADQGEKKDAYLQLPSLSVYAMVEQESPAVVVYRRRGDAFVREDYDGLAATIPLSEIEISLPLADIYAGVEFVPESESE